VQHLSLVAAEDVMIDVTKYGLNTKTSADVSATDKFIPLPAGLIGTFAPVAGTQYYMTLWGKGTSREVVRVLGISGSKIHVDRGIDQTAAQAWPAGTCIGFDWNPSQLCEMWSSCSGNPTDVMAPGTYCIECTSCITVDAEGRITNIDGAVKQC
jgi:hypothetical protein